jgi:hypothetical protein
VYQIQRAGTVLTHPIMNLYQHNLIKGNKEIQNKKTLTYLTDKDFILPENKEIQYHN